LRFIISDFCLILWGTDQHLGISGLGVFLLVLFPGLHFQHAFLILVKPKEESEEEPEDKLEEMSMGNWFAIRASLSFR